MPSRASRTFALTLLAGSLALACGPGGSKSQADRTRIVHQYREDRYALTVETIDGAGGRRVRAEVAPRSDYHLSVEFPSSFELAGRKAEREEDAAESDAGHLAFEGALPRDAAHGRVPGQVRFGICLREELCEAVSHDFWGVVN
jgi:hypothetical protein